MVSKPTPGSIFHPDHRTQGELIDLLERRRYSTHTKFNRGVKFKQRDYKQCMVRNDHTEETLIPQYGIMEVSDYGVLPTASSTLLLSGTEATTSRKTIAIAQEPIPFGEVKKCVISGVSICLVSFPEGGKEYTYARKIEGDITKLEANTVSGNVEILNPRTQSTPGDYWCQVRIIPSQTFDYDQYNETIINSLDCCRIPCADSSDLIINPSWDNLGLDWPESWRFTYASPTNPFWGFANGSWILGWDAIEEIWITDDFDGPCGETGTDIPWHWALVPLSDPSDLGPRDIALVLVPTTNLTTCISGQDVVGTAFVNRYEFVPACANYMILRDFSATSYYGQSGTACSICLVPASDVLANHPVTVVACKCGSDLAGSMDVPYYLTLEETMTEDEAIAGCCDYHELFIGNKYTFQLNTTGYGCPACQTCWTLGGDSLKHPDAFCGSVVGGLLLTPGVNTCGTDFLGFSLESTPPDGYDNIGIYGAVSLRCTSGQYYFHLGLSLLGIDYKGALGTFGCNLAYPLSPPKHCSASYRSDPLTRAEVEAMGSISLYITSNVWEDAACACAYCTLPDTITLTGL